MAQRSLFRLALLAVVSMSIAAQHCEAGSLPTVYVVGSGNEFGTLNLSTGTFTSIATLSFPAADTNDQLFGLGFGANGQLYGVDSRSDAILWQVNTGTGQLTEVGTIGQSADGAGADAAGDFYGLTTDSNANLYNLNPLTNSATVVGNTGLYGSGLVAPTADGTQVFASVYGGGGPDGLSSIDTSTGKATVLNVDTGYTLYSGLVVDGTLYAFATNGAILTFSSTNNWAPTVVATYSLPNDDKIEGAAVFLGSVPEPSGVVMGLIAITAGGAFGLRRRRAARAA